MNDQDEMFERATETPAFLGFPQHMPTHLPGGLDGVEPGEKSKSEVEVEELKKRGEKLKASNDRSYAKMVRIAELANECVLKTTHSEYAPGQYGQDYRTFGKVMCEIRGIVGPGVLERLAALAPKDKPLDPTAPEIGRAVSMKPPHKGKLFKYKHISSCRGTYIYDRVVINGAHLHADLHYDNGGLEQHGSVYVCDSPRAFCFVTFNTSGATKCDYAMRGLLAGIAKRLVYHHKNLIKRKAKWADAKAAKKGGAK